MKEIAFMALAVFVAGVSSQFAADQAALIAQIKSKSNPEARPYRKTLVEANIELFDVLDIDIGKEIMTISGMIYVAWQDERLAWTNYTDINKIAINSKHVWVPALSIENEVNKVGQLGNSGEPLLVYRNGTVIWGSQVSTTTSCSANIKYFPYDTQTCNIIIVGWSTTADELDLVADSLNPIDLHYYRTNGGWEILSTSYEVSDLYEEEEVYRQVDFFFTFRRKSRYYALDIMVPLGLISLLMTFVFLIPLELTGEKVGYCLTILLAFTVYLTIVSSKLPPLSDQICILQVYLIMALIMATAITACTLLVMKVYKDDEMQTDSELPDGLLKKITYFSGRWFRLTEASKSNKSEKVTTEEGTELRTASESNENENGRMHKDESNKNDPPRRSKSKLLAENMDKCFLWFFAAVFLFMYVVLLMLLYIQ